MRRKYTSTSFQINVSNLIAEKILFELKIVVLKHSYPQRKT